MSDREELIAIWNADRIATVARVDAIDAALDALAADALAEAARAEARREAHTLAGTAAIFGLAAASRTAREIERLLATGAALGPTDAARLRTLAADLRAALDRAPAL